MKAFILLIALALCYSQVAADDGSHLRGAKAIEQTETDITAVEEPIISNESESTLISHLPDLPIEILTPEQEAYRLSHTTVPTPPEGFKQVKITNLQKDKGIMQLYAYGIPSFLLKAIAAHHQLMKAHTHEEKEHFAAKGFLMPGPYLLDLNYIFKKKTEDGYTFIFGVVVNRCMEKACTTRPYPCKNTAHFSVFAPTAEGMEKGLKKGFLNWEVVMAPEGYLQCPMVRY